MMPRRVPDEVLIDAIGQGMAQITHGLRVEISALEKRIAELESTPQLKYVGTWEANKAYWPGNVVTFKGAMWHCRQNTVSQPPSEDWQLCVQRGRDARGR
jgi:hypothetical protein